MVLLDLFPAGILQFQLVAEKGLWFARSASFVEGSAFQNLTLARMAGGLVFTIGGLLPLTWFILNGKRKGKSIEEPASQATMSSAGKTRINPETVS
jgi:nitric oxide reductase subunit B